MADKYTTEEKEKIARTLEQLWGRMRTNSRLRTFARVARKVKAQAATVWRWHKGKSLPSRWHFYQIRKFLGYGDKW